MNFLLIDTETTGLPRRVPNGRVILPRLVSIAWMICSSERIVIERYYVIRPTGFRIPASATAIHGISTFRARLFGRAPRPVLGKLIADIDRLSPRAIVAHNLRFDLEIVSAELRRYFSTRVLDSLGQVCTMRSTAGLCRIPGKFGYKCPTLMELHSHLFPKATVEARHHALADLRILHLCFTELRNRGNYKFSDATADEAAAGRERPDHVTRPTVAAPALAHADGHEASSLTSLCRRLFVIHVVLGLALLIGFA
jgi:DNA polymerase III epsilon subunit-like protein